MANVLLSATLYHAKDGDSDEYIIMTNTSNTISVYPGDNLYLYISVMRLSSGLGGGKGQQKQAYVQFEWKGNSSPFETSVPITAQISNDFVIQKVGIIKATASGSYDYTLKINYPYVSEENKGIEYSEDPKIKINPGGG